MVVQLHGFDWDLYSEKVMPAFAQWFLEGSELALLTLFEKTRCAYEEQFLPDPMQRLRVWPRARAFMQTLPRGPYSRREYQKLCNPLQYTTLSDRYLYRHPPQLYQHSNALRSVWGSIVESFCLPWSPSSGASKQSDAPGELPHTDVSPLLVTSGESISHGELASLLTEAGLSDLAREVESQAAQSTQAAQTTQATIEIVEFREWEGISKVSDGVELNESDDNHIIPARIEASGFEQLIPDLPDDFGDEAVIAAEGIFIGQAPNLLHLRGWLSGISIRAMGLFEYLACGRRSMPFGFETGEPFGAFAGYLTPDEVWQLADCLEGIIPPDQEVAEEDYLNYRYQHYGIPPAFRLIDEVLPLHAADLLFAVRKASAQGLGLISSME
jgi:hypothetical protein